MSLVKQSRPIASDFQGDAAGGTPRGLSTWAANGVNRLSVGVENYAKTVEYLSQIVKQEPQRIAAPITRSTTAI